MMRKLEVRFSRPLRGARLWPLHAPMPPVPPDSGRPSALKIDLDKAVEDALRKDIESLQREVEQTRSLAQVERQALQEQAKTERLEVQRVLAALFEATEGLNRERQRLVGDMQRATIELAMAVASRFLHDRVQSGEYPFERVVRQLAQKLEVDGPVSVRLHPDDMAALRRRLGGEASRLLKDRRVDFVEDMSLGRGDCVVACGDLSVSSRLDEQLAELRQHLLTSKS